MSAFSALFRHQRGLLLGWSIGLFLYMLLIGLAFSAVKDSPEFDELWAQYPEAVRAAFGDEASLTSVEGFLEAEAMALLPILIAILLTTSATRPLVGSEESGALDHVLARPVSRRAYILGVVAHQSALVALVLAAALVGGLLGFALVGVGGADLLGIVGSFIDLVPVSAFFIGFGLFLGAFFHRRAPAIGVGVATVLSLFVLEIIRNLVTELSALRWLNPLAYYEASRLFHGEPDLAYYLMLPLAGAALAGAAVWRFERKDLYA